MFFRHHGVEWSHLRIFRRYGVAWSHLRIFAVFFSLGGLLLFLLQHSHPHTHVMEHRDKLVDAMEMYRYIVDGVPEINKKQVADNPALFALQAVAQKRKNEIKKETAAVLAEVDDWLNETYKKYGIGRERKMGPLKTRRNFKRTTPSQRRMKMRMTRKNTPIPSPSSHPPAHP